MDTSKYYIGRPCKAGHDGLRLKSNRACVECERVRQSTPQAKVNALARGRKFNQSDQGKKSRADWHVANKPRRLAAEAVRYEENKEHKLDQMAKRYAALKAEIIRKRKDARRARPEHYKESNRKQARFHTPKRRAAKLCRTPPWVDLESIKEIYRNCPAGDHVDHIIPLQGKTISGLHVPWNLQYLPAVVNCAKGNRFDENILEGFP